MIVLLVKLDEVLRRDIIQASKRQSPERLLRSKKYSIKDFKQVNFKQLFERDTFTWISKVGKYTVAISFEGPFEELKFYVKSMRGPNRINRLSEKLVASALSKALDTNDLYVTCSCPDFKYRFSYYATQADFKFGKPENRPNRFKRTNKYNNNGMVCKHILAVLQGKRWVPFAAKAWLQYMKQNPELTESFLWDMDIKRAKKLAKQAKDSISDASDDNIDTKV